MTGSTTSIFRRRALRDYVASKQKVELPMLARPQSLLILWLLLALLSFGMLLAGLALIPVYITGTALFLDSRTNSGASEPMLLLLLPPESLDDLAKEQCVLVTMDGIRDGVTARVKQFEGEVFSPEAIRTRFALSPSLSAIVTQPAIVALARVEHIPPQLPASALTGSISTVRVEVKSRRLIPLLSHF